MESCWNFWRILITTVYFKDQNWISKTMYCISCSMVCKTIFCSEFLNILDKAGRKTRRRRRRGRRTQTIAKRYALHTNAINLCISSFCWNAMYHYTSLYFVITLNLHYIQNDICTSFILRPDCLYSKQGHLYFGNCSIIFFNSLSSF